MGTIYSAAQFRFSGNFELHSFMLWIPQGSLDPLGELLHLAQVATNLPEVQT